MRRITPLLLIPLLLLQLTGCRESHYEKGLIYLRQGRLDEAEAEFKEELRKSPSAKVYIALARVYMGKGEGGRAIDALKKAIELEPGSVEAHLLAAEVYLSRNQAELAMEMCLKAIELDPKNARALNLMGLAHLQRGRLAQAEAKFKEAMRADPKEVQSYLNLGGLYERTGRVDEAERVYSCLLYTSPSPRDRG